MFKRQDSVGFFVVFGLLDIGFRLCFGFFFFFLLLLFLFGVLVNTSGILRGASCFFIKCA
jgi:hypothetical protein